MKLTYIDLINRFWRLDEQHHFSNGETRLYYYLLKIANASDPVWPDHFDRPDPKTAADNSLSVNTMKKYRQRLASVGLIDFQAGGKGYASSTRYQIRYQELTPKAEQTQVRCQTSYQELTPNLTPNGNKVSNKVSNSDTLSKYKRLKIFYSLTQKGARKKVAQLVWLQNRKHNRKAPLVPRVPPAPVVIPLLGDPFTLKRDSERLNVPFSEWYSAYGLNIAESQCRKLWILLSNTERSKAKAHTLLYVKSTPDRRWRKAPSNYLDEKTFNDDIIDRHDKPQTFNAQTSQSDRRRELAKPRPGTSFGKL